MPRLTVRFVGAAVLCAVVASSLPGQRGRRGDGDSAERHMVYHALVYLGDAALQKELKLTVDQVKKVTEFRDKWLRGSKEATATTAKAKAKAKARVESQNKAADTFLGDALDVSQLERLRQVTLQLVVKGPFAEVPAEALTGLELTDEQKKRLAAPAAKLEDVLTAEQKQTWTRMIGAPITQALAKQLPGEVRPADKGIATASGSATPAVMRALRTASKALGLTEAQQKALDEAEARWQMGRRFATMGGPRTRGGARGDAVRGARDQANKAYEQAVAAILQPQQRLLLEQVLVRQELSGGHVGAVFTNARGAKYLELTDEQRTKCAEVTQARREELAALLLRGEHPAQLEAKAKAFQAETVARLDAALTPAQRERRKALQAAPEAEPDPARVRIATALIGLEVGTYLTALEVPQLLNLSDEQKKKLPDLQARLRRDLRGGLGVDAKVAQELSRKLDQELVALLGATKRLRYRQVVLQQVEKQTMERAGGAPSGRCLRSSRR